MIILGDAEFSNAPLIRWFEDKPNWYFVFRFQGTYLLKRADDRRWLSALEWQQEWTIQPGQVRQTDPVSFTQEHQIPNLSVTIHWEEQEADPLYLIASLPTGQLPHLLYEYRFWIETLFAHFKSRGFNLDKTHLTKPEQIDRMILVLAIATCIALHIGTEIYSKGDQHLIDRSDRRDLSLFQLGLRGIVRLALFEKLVLKPLCFDWALQLPKPGFQPR